MQLQLTCATGSGTAGGARLAPLVFFLVALSAAAQERIDITRAIDYALAQNKQLIRTHLPVESGRLREADAAAEFQPNVLPEFGSSVVGGQRDVRYGVRTTTKLPWGTALSGSVGGVSSSGGPEGSQTRGTYRIALEQPIFRSFGAEVHREPVLQAESASTAARRRYELQKADLVLEVVQTFENILRLEQQVRADKESLKRSDALFRVTQVREGLGKTTRVDTLRVELMRGQALARLQAGQQRLAAARRDLADLLGFPLEVVFDLQAAPVLELDTSDPKAAVDTALANRLDYAQAIQDYDDAARAARLADRRRMPDLKLVVSYDEYPTTLTSFGAVPFGRPLWFVGIATVTDSNPARDRIAMRQAKVTQTSASQAIDLMKLSISRQVLHQLKVYERAQAELKIAGQNFDLAARRARLAKDLFELGRGDHFSVTDAETALLQAEAQLFSARADASISGYQLTRVMGTITETPKELKASSYTPQ